MLAAFCHGGQEDIMRIDRVDIIRVLNPFKHPFQTSFTKFENRDALLVKVYSKALSAGVNARLSTGLSTIRKTTAPCFIS